MIVNIFEILSKNSGIYCIKNKINNKKYIGYASSFKDRKRIHFERLQGNRHINKKLQNAFNKYGENNFSFHILLYVPKIRWLLAMIEKLYIFVYNSYNNGYNLTKGGDGNSNNRNEETRKKISLAQIGRETSEETRKKIGDFHRGRIRPKETGERISKALNGKVQSDEHRKKNAEVRRGRKSNSTKQYVGIYYDNNGDRKKKWRATIRDENGKIIRIGRYLTEIEAVIAYDNKSWEFYHNLEYLNFPENHS